MEPKVPWNAGICVSDMSIFGTHIFSGIREDFGLAKLISSNVLSYIMIVNNKCHSL